ncbi:MAG: nucleotidyltransferase domain-containing protein [Candidatus Baltobacteraceae bacterium]
MALQLYAGRCTERRRLLDEAAAHVVALCRAHPEVRAAYVLGSYARATIGPKSDLDVLIERETDLGIVDRVADLAFEHRAPVRMNLVVITPENAERRSPARVSAGRSWPMRGRFMHRDRVATATFRL